MSGLEVVGVVLGAIPLIVAALDSYKTTSQRLRFFRHKEPFVDQLIQALNEQLFLIETDLFLTLRATDLEEEDIIDLIDKHRLSLFHDPNIADAVKQYLGDGYRPYQNAVTRCEHALGVIVTDMGGLMSNSQLKNCDLSDIVRNIPRNDGKYEFRKRIKFSLKKEELDRRIKELDDSTERLRRVRDTSVLRQEVTFQTTSRTTAKFTTALHSVRGHASRLYSAVSLGYMAGCHPEHEIRLYLKGRSGEMQNIRTRSLKKPKVTFTMALTSVPGPSTCEAEIKVLENEMPGCSDINSQGIQRSAKGKVAIMAPSPSCTPDPPLDEIDDLCLSIHRANTGKMALDLYLSERGSLCYHQLPANSGMSIDVSAQSHETLTLEQILCLSPDSRWTPNQRLALAFNITSSLMQLHSTPWLAAPWTKKSICFLRETRTQDAAGTQFFFKPPQPFITHKFSGCSVDSTYQHNAKHSLLELGIILLELWHARTVEAYAAEAKMTLEDSIGSRYEVGRHWLDLSAYYIPLFYLDAVTRCIECTFATGPPTPNWDDGIFRKSVCEYVLKPLWENCPVEFRK